MKKWVLTVHSVSQFRHIPAVVRIDHADVHWIDARHTR